MTKRSAIDRAIEEIKKPYEVDPPDWDSILRVLKAAKRDKARLFLARKVVEAVRFHRFIHVDKNYTPYGCYCVMNEGLHDARCNTLRAEDKKVDDALKAYDQGAE